MAERKPHLDLHPFQRVERQRSALLKLVRAGFLIVFITTASLAVLNTVEGDPDRVNVFGIAIKGTWQVLLTLAILIGGAAWATDLLTPTKKISTLMSIFFGLMIAMIATYAIGIIIDLLVELYSLGSLRDPIVLTAKAFIGIGLTYICIATVLQTQDDFRLVIPYVEFAKQLRGARPLLIDSSALIDARIADVAATGIFQAPLVVPRFIIHELQLLADSTDAIRRSRGRRGLDVIAQLQREPRLDVTIDETAIPGKSVDQMLLELARRTNAIIVTTDTALSRVSNIHDVPVLSMHQLAIACKPVTGTGERVRLQLVKAGEQPGQAVGYLPDGTMVVVNEAEPLVGESIEAEVESTIQTSAGRMLFARLAGSSAVRVDEGSTPASEASSVSNEDSDAESESEPAADVESDAASKSGPFPPQRPTVRAKAAARRNPRR
ncbi:MAG: hypothetical protein KDA31_00725 [Phycisphaerales bacterium]|nr:hypothetical protein [Phycisphaerales bacterium]MCB9837425.1 hypothetical protein [Phycisphaera sp.]